MDRVSRYHVHVTLSAALVAIAIGFGIVGGIVLRIWEPGLIPLLGIEIVVLLLVIDEFQEDANWGRFDGSD